MSAINNLNSQILREIGMLARSIQTIDDIKFKELNLKKGQFVFLTRICENHGINQIDLSNMLKVDKTTTTKAIQKLIEADFVDKKRDEDDKRMWRLYPKKRAIDAYTLIIKEENRNIEVCFKGFSLEEKEIAYHLIKKMGINIESNWRITKSF